MSPTDNVNSSDSMTKTKTSFVQQENSKTSNLLKISSDGIEVDEVSKENFNNKDAIVNSRHPLVNAEVSGEYLEWKVSILQHMGYAEWKSQLERKDYDDKLEGSSIAHFVSNHAAFFIALSIVSFTLAVLITLFCFVFP